MAEQEQDPPVQEVDEEEDTPNYKPPAPKPIDEIVNADAEDESLRKYKEALLGNNTKEIVVIDKDKDRVIVDKMALKIPDRDPLELDISQPLDELKKTTWTIKEGCTYQMMITFHVQKEIVSGLRYQHKVFRKGVKVGAMKQMMGSYAPKLEEYTFTTPVEEAPSGLLSRGDYKIKSRFVDDDDHEFMTWEFNLAVRKDWN